MTLEEILEDIREGASIRSLVWREPFGSLMLHGKVETRTWDTKYRGYVLICTAQRSCRVDEILEVSGMPNFNRMVEKPLLLKNGYAIAIGKLVSTHKMQKEDEESTYVMYDATNPRYCHVYKNVVPIDPFPFMGHQGWRIQNAIEIINAINKK